MKPYYKDASTTLYLGDCREIIPQLDAGNIGLVVMDPPYGIQHSSNHGASWQGTQITGDEDCQVRDAVIDALDYEGLPMFVFGSWKRPKPPGVRGVLIWDKGPAFGMGDLSFPWKMSHEEIYVLGAGFQGRRDEGVIRGHLCVSWESKGRCHPHEKPVSLIRYLIGKTKTGLVFDPFSGSGTTLRAAKDLGRKSIGVEISEAYCEITARRLEQGILDFSPPPDTFHAPSFLENAE